MVVVPDHLSQLLKRYGRLREIHRMFEGAVLELTSARTAPICIENCGRCCHVPFAWEVEADYLTSSILGNGALLKTADLCQSWLLDKVSGVKGNTPPSQAEFQVVMRSPCPFLGTDKRCSIYDSRPISCRSYGVTRLPGRECPRPLGINETQTARAYYAGPGGDAIKEATTGLVGQSHSGLLPTLLYQRIRPGDFRVLVADGKIASAKLVIARTVSPAILWQSPISRRIGNSPN